MSSAVSLHDTHKPDKSLFIVTDLVSHVYHVGPPSDMNAKKLIKIMPDLSCYIHVFNDLSI